MSEVKSIKGMNAQMQCRGFQFEVGKTYTHEGDVIVCGEGFHACPVEHHPLSVFEYYPPTSRFFEVTQGGKTHGKDNKLASATITIDVEITIHDLVKRAWDYVWSRAVKSDESHVTVDQGAASSTGYQGAASSTGDRGAASSTGDQGAASVANGSAAMTTGYQGRVMGETDGCPLFCVELDGDWKLVSVAKGITGKGKIKAGVWYQCRNGKLVECK